MENPQEGIVCYNQHPGHFLCSQAGCEKPAVICDTEQCKCHTEHISHRRIHLHQMLSESAKTCVAPNKHMLADFLREAAECFRQLEREYTDTIKASPHEAEETLFDQRRVFSSATGNDMATLLASEEKASQHFQETLGELRRTLRQTRDTIEGLWKKELKGIAIRQADIIQSLGNATSIRISSCTSEEWKQIGQRISTRPALVGLHLQDCGFGDQICADVCRSASLRFLTMTNCRITDYGLAPFRDMRQLKHLVLSPFTRDSTDSNSFTIGGFKQILSSLKQLPALQVLEMPLPNEEGIHIDHSSIGDRGVGFVVRNLPHLTWLVLRHNSISDEGVRAIASRLHALTRLSIQYNEVTDSGLEALSEKLTSLTWLGISNNHLTDRSAELIAERLHCLSWIYIRNNQLTDDGKQLLKRTFPKARLSA